MKKQVAVIFGGLSSEHEVSCKSALTVMRNLSSEKYEVIRIGITKEGRWLFVSSEEEIEDGSWVNGEISAILSPDALQKGVLCNKGGTYELVKVDVLYPVLHGKYGEDGTIQGLFEMSGIPYVGAGVLSSAISMDKLSTKIFVDKLGICQARFVADTAYDLSRIEMTVAETEKKLGYPVFVKPSNAGSSQGVSKVDNREELKKAILVAKEHDNRVLIEEAIAGREIECAVLGGKHPEASCLGEILSAAEFYDYDAKYNNEESKTIVNPEMPEDVKEQIRENAVSIYECVSAFSLARVDFFLEENTNRVVFNEINTLPGFTNISMYPMLWNAMGYSTATLLDKIIETAGERYGTAGNS